jgi:hypothetical protein
MTSQQFANQMMSFQAEGGFIIPKEQQSPWWRAYGSKREDAFKMATEKYLDTRENNFIPKPGELKELYKNSVTEIDRDAKTQEPPEDRTPTIPASAVKPVASVNPSQCITQRAHNLVNRWRGYGGYGETGKIDGKDGGKYTAVLDQSIIDIHGDLRTPVENEAYRLATMAGSKYEGVNIPPAVRARNVSH